ncbi:hypothetical protein GC207_10225 [bacterium]|nr:hypothetical protein [bacterium]
MAAIGLNVVRAVFLVSLVISAYGLIRLRPWAAMAAYAQFPFRLLFCAFSFWFVFDLIGIASGMSWFIAAVVLETARMVATAVTHARVLA